MAGAVMVLGREKLGSLKPSIAVGLLVAGALVLAHPISMHAAEQACLVTAAGSESITVRAPPAAGVAPAERTGMYFPFADCSGIEIVRGDAVVHFGGRGSERR